MAQMSLDFAPLYSNEIYLSKGSIYTIYLFWQLWNSYWVHLKCMIWSHTYFDLRCIRPADSKYNILYGTKTSNIVVWVSPTAFKNFEIRKVLLLLVLAYMDLLYWSKQQQSLRYSTYNLCVLTIVMSVISNVVLSL
jgi:hypothetical protein